MTAFYDFFRKLKFNPGSPTNSSTSGVSAVMSNCTISGNQLTVGTLDSGVISVGMVISGGAITANTYIIANGAGDGNGSIWTLNKSYGLPLGPFTVNGQLSVITTPTEVEADSIVDTANIVAGRNISFSVKDTTDPAGLDQYQRFTIDSVTINGPDYQTYVPLGTTKLRLEKNLGDATSDIRIYADPESTLTVTRTGTNELKIGHTAPNIPFSQEQIEDMSAQLLVNGSHREITVIYDDLGTMPLTPIGQNSTTGLGIGALFRISILSNQYNAAIEAPGSGYQVGDVITINGNTFPTGTNGFTAYGTLPFAGNDLRITITEVHSGAPLYVAAKGYTLVSGSIVGFTSNGTPVSPANIDLLVDSTLENVTSRGASSTHAITLSNTTDSTTYNSGALKITAGGLGVFGNINAKGYIATENQLKSTIAQGTAPLVVSSTTMVSNLQAETASKWHTARTVSFATGDMAGSFTIDGSANVDNVSLTATAPFLSYIETEIAKSVPYGSVGQVPFIATESTRLTEQDYTAHFGQFIETDTELDAAKLRFESPVTIFNTWARFSHDTTANQPANAGELASWTYNSVTDRVLSTVNSSTVIGFVSPKTYSNYTHEVRLYSPGGDDDAIGVLIAWYVDPADGRQYTLSAVRSPGGVGFTWRVIYNYGRSDEVVIADQTANIKWGNGAYGATDVAAGYVTNQTLGGWDDFTTVGTKVKVVRNGDSITVSTTDFNGVNYVAAADIVIDLVGTAVLNKFRGPKSYGYLALSQDQATFEILGFTDSDNAIFDMRTGGMWTYAGNTWTLQNLVTSNIWTSIGPGRFVYDIYTEKLFYIETSTIRRLTRDEYDVFTTGVASPGPTTFPTKSIRAFDAYTSTDFPGSYFVGLTVTGVNGVRSGQLAMNWNSEEVAPTGLYFRTNDDTSTTADWSPWRRVLVDGHTAAFSGVNSTSTATGAVTVTGGVGISQNLYVGDNLYVEDDVVITGNLTVNGTTTTINSTTLTVDDKNIELASVATPTDVTADGAGITIKGATDKTFNWVDATDAWTSSEHLALAAGKSIFLNGSTSGTITLSAPASAGTNTITFPAAGGTVALLSSLEVQTAAASGSGSLTYTGGVFTFTPAAVPTLDSVTTSGNTTTNDITVKSVKGKYIDVVDASATGGATITPNWNNGSVQRFTLDQNFTLATPANMPTGGNLTVILTQDGTGSRVMTANASYKFASGYKTLSTSANAIDIINIFYDGSIYYASLTTGYA